MTAALSQIQPVSLIFKLNNGLVARALDGLSDADVWRSPGGGNSIGWMLGHLTESRIGLLAAIGAPMETGWGRRFARGSQPGTRETYPARAAIEEAWKATHHRMRDAFAALDEAKLATPATLQLPGATTLADQIAFFAFHESYHVGQIGYVRKALGYAGIAG